MCFPQLSFAASAGMLAAIGAAALLTAYVWGDSSTASGARILDNSLLSYQIKVALDQDTALSTRQIRIRSDPDGRVTLTGWVDTPEMARRVDEDVKRFVNPAKLDNQSRVFSRTQMLGGGLYIPAGLSPEVPTSIPAAYRTAKHLRRLHTCSHKQTAHGQ